MALVALVGSGEMKEGYLRGAIQMQSRGSECLGRSIKAPTAASRGGGVVAQAHKLPQRESVLSVWVTYSDSQ